MKDHLGSTNLIVDAEGNVVSEMRYKAWGETRHATGDSLTDYAYTGQRQEQDLGFYYYKARWYDPALGRFMQADTIVPEAGNPMALDRYLYSANNPPKMTDPSGHCWGIFGFMRQLPSYDSTCNNLDMAWLIVNHDDANLGEKIIAGGYMAFEGVAHAALVVGSVGVACGLSGACAAIVEPALGIGTAACADGDCANEVQIGIKSAEALRLNFERGLDLIGKGKLKEFLNFFARRGSDAPIPRQVPAEGIKSIVGELQAYVVGKPTLGQDLDIIFVGENIPQLSGNQLQALNSLAQQSGYSNVHAQFLSNIQAAALRFATSAANPLHAVPNIRNPMLWRLIE